MSMLKYENRNDPIERLGLTTRSKRCLLDANINTVEQLCSRSDQELRKIPRFGATCLRDVKRRLLDVYGVRLMCPIESEPESVHKDIALRDYFAAKAMQAMISNGMYDRVKQDRDRDGYNLTGGIIPMIASISYEYAEEMLYFRRINDQ